MKGNIKMIDYLLVGAGLFNATLARLLKAKDKTLKIVVVEKRNHIAGNIYTENKENINVHKYGAHIFHTSDKDVWKFVNDIVEFNRFTNAPIAYYKGQVYNLPFNMNTFSKMWNIYKIEDAKRIIEEQKKEITRTPENLEEQAISLVGRDIYEKLIKGYTEKQWGRDCKELPTFIIKRLPVRFTYDNNYFNDTYQGIPMFGYTDMVEKMFGDVEIILNTDYLRHKDEFEAKHIIYTGAIDEFFDYKLGKLEYRSLRFEEELIDKEDYQGNAVMNFTEREVPYTRIIEHKHFLNDISQKTIITKEYPSEWKEGDEPYYPINNDKNQSLYEKYKKLAEDTNVYFGGRLGQYKYYDMDKVIIEGFKLFEKLV